ncbi:hypothetical protein ADEAN_000666300 [Angomonas deanei]|uniref:Alpha/beta hydrolase family n=1 Tax=Angomonas deanei TaxID=59799 RepID=A0A7G2CH65_9TRYP|nr:hypothetical protein ADEAN_000666300 [Angomonas deanei]
MHIGATELEFSKKIARDPSVYLREASGLPDPVPLSPDATPVPIVLVAHSMGAMVLMHWAWREHIKIWSNKIRLGDHSPTLYQNVFTNDLYKIVGAVVLDMAPADRPATFNNTIRMIEFLTQIPLLLFKNAKEVEVWLLENGPKDVFNQQNIFQIRYHLSNLDFSDKNQPKWKIGLSEIIGGLHSILWEEGGFDSMKLAWDTLNFANRRRVLAHKPIWEHAEKFSEVPFCFVFGETSSYYNPKAVENIQKHFQEPHIVDIKGADHFLFMRHKPQFMRVLRGFLQEIENKSQIK